MSVRTVQRFLPVLLLCWLSATDTEAGCYGAAGGAQRRFLLRGGEAFDQKTGLTWKRCGLGLVWDGKQGCTGTLRYASLDEAAQAAKAEGADWHVPSGPELESIIDPACGKPVVDKAVFPDISADEDGKAEYWTTNPVGAANLVYFFDFMTGSADGHSRGFKLAVRLVKSAR
jgi:hypothetical protein